MRTVSKSSDNNGKKNKKHLSLLVIQYCIQICCKEIQYIYIYIYVYNIIHIIIHISVCICICVCVSQYAED